MTDTDKIQTAVNLIAEYGCIDGSHHKQWLLDQLINLLVDDYEEWVAMYEAGEDGPQTYEWDTGIAP